MNGQLAPKDATEWWQVQQFFHGDDNYPPYTFWHVLDDRLVSEDVARSVKVQREAGEYAVRCSYRVAKVEVVI